MTLVKKVHAQVPGIFSFEKAALFVTDLKDSNMISWLTEGQTFDGIDYIKDIVQFPTNMGITGKAYQSRKALVSNLGNRDPQYFPELDNIINESNIRNMLVLPLTLHNKPVGIL